MLAPQPAAVRKTKKWHVVDDRAEYLPLYRGPTRVPGTHTNPCRTMQTKKHTSTSNKDNEKYKQTLTNARARIHAGPPVSRHDDLVLLYKPPRSVGDMDSPQLARRQLRYMRRDFRERIMQRMPLPTSSSRPVHSTVVEHSTEAVQDTSTLKKIAVMRMPPVRCLFLPQRQPVGTQ